MRKGKQRLVCKECGKDLKRDDWRGMKPICINRNCKLVGEEQEGEIREVENEGYLGVFIWAFCLIWNFNYLL